MKQLHALLGLLLLVSFTSCASTIKNATTESFKVAGKCEMCKNAIETAANRKGIAEAEWNVETKVLKLTFDSEKTSSEDVLKRIAYAGYDNEEFLAPDDAYSKLPDCCKYDRLKKVAAEESTTTVEVKDSVIHQVEQKNALSQVYGNYFQLKDALLKDNAASASQKAGELVKAIESVDQVQMSAQEKSIWSKAETDFLMHAKHIAESKDLAHQREHFAPLSQNIITLAKVFKADEPMYIQHCPMYNDGEGADWISKENTVKNPYYGSSMLTCGKTTMTIK